jgi:hypothetical protein
MGTRAKAGKDLKVEQGKRRDAFLARLRRATQQTSQKKAAGANKSK